MKPVELMEYCIKNNTKGSDIVYDAFLGSGSTLIAAEKTGRKCYGMELDPKYVDVIVKRWQEFTGKEAIHEDGRKFNEVCNG
jgi:site-specific DNA-methyltransferase (adenine-specific)